MQSLVNLNANMAGIFLGNDLYTMNMDDRHHRTCLTWMTVTIGHCLT